MTVFKTKWIILKIDKIKDKDLLFNIFTKDYWKIRANKKFSKREKSLDSGYLINFEIHTKPNSQIHKIRNIKILSEFNLNKDKSFDELNKYLEILAILYKEYPDWLKNNWIFEIIEEINSNKKIDENKLILAKLKLISQIWNLKTENDNLTIKKILKFISNSNIKDILKLTWISWELKKELDLLT